MGTRMVSSLESPVHDNYKMAILNGDEQGTAFLSRFGSPAFRVIRTEKVSVLEHDEKVGMDTLGSILDLYFGGDMEASIAMAGQVMGRIDTIMPVRQILEETMEEFHETIERVAALAHTMPRPRVPAQR